MAQNDKKNNGKIDTTGHEWDGIQELNNPLPKWWVWVFYICIIWSVGYWVVYPTWPTISSFTKGTFGWASRDAVATDLENLKTFRGEMGKALSTHTVAEIASDQKMLSHALAQGKAAFGDNCAPCHGAGGGGNVGFPNLNDDDWIWGGKLEDIELTLKHGIRHEADANTRQGAMLAFGRDGILQKQDIYQVANYVRSLSGLKTEKDADLTVGAKIYAENCASCHGDKGLGQQEMGAPNLADAIWLYGSDLKTVTETIYNGRAGVMPAWQTRLDDATIKSLAIYVHNLGGGKK